MPEADGEDLCLNPGVSGKCDRERSGIPADGRSNSWAETAVVWGGPLEEQAVRGPPVHISSLTTVQSLLDEEWGFETV